MLCYYISCPNVVLAYYAAAPQTSPLVPLLLLPSTTIRAESLCVLNNNKTELTPAEKSSDHGHGHDRQPVKLCNSLLLLPLTG